MSTYDSLGSAHTTVAERVGRFSSSDTSTYEEVPRLTSMLKPMSLEAHTVVLFNRLKHTSVLSTHGVSKMGQPDEST